MSYYNPKIRCEASRTAPYLPTKSLTNTTKKTLVLDLDETLVHASFQSVLQADVVIPVKKEILHVQFRPGAQEFIRKMSKLYELVVFTASVESYALPLMKKLDPDNLCSSILCRDHCTQQGAMFVKDMSKLGRSLEDVILLDNSPNSYYYQPENGLPIENWYDSLTDTELYNYYELLEALAFVPDVREYLPKVNSNEKFDFHRAKEVAKEIFNNSSSPARSRTSKVSSYHKHRTAQSVDNFSVKQEVENIQKSISNLKEGFGEKPLTYQAPNWRNHTPVYNRRTHDYPQTPLSQVKSYFDSYENTRDSRQEIQTRNYSHTRLSDVAYHRNYDYTKKPLNSYQKQGSTTASKRPATAKYSYTPVTTTPKTANCTPMKHQPTIKQRDFTKTFQAHSYNKEGMNRSYIGSKDYTSLAPKYTNSTGYAPPHQRVPAKINDYLQKNYSKIGIESRLRNSQTRRPTREYPRAYFNTQMYQSGQRDR
ncbi:unnamed protein product [Moneuplotes crassus]|uniref:FCP1 homology domain-containing protein n=1 Tax=Euplotes crassus TaxID=5936 RepID=A0AAD1UHX9_EUPCR|nr:unnamed protein product [Moneuplotes crassus]